MKKFFGLDQKDKKEEKIEALVNMGFSREMAIRGLNDAN